MKKLKTMNRNDLINAYWDKFGSSGENIPRNRLIAALFYGKNATYITEEELNDLKELE